MRKLFITLAFIPITLHFGVKIVDHTKVITSKLGSGRGTVNPPVVSDLAQINCLATMIYGEARGESKLGQVAVAHTALNRAVTKSVCDIVLAPKQYSIFNNNPRLVAAALSLQVQPVQRNVIDEKSWGKAWTIAHNTYLGITPDPTNGATHYVADKVMKIKKYRYPKWTKQFTQVAVIENHRFFVNAKSVDKVAAL
jgi:spore germination cell wall hydrolase CwlJ-like protein